MFSETNDFDELGGRSDLVSMLLYVWDFFSLYVCH